MMKIELNNNLNGIEVIFDSKPETAIIEGLKFNGFRWHNVKKLWYAKQTPARLAYVESIGTIEAKPAKQEEKKINLDNLGENKPYLYGAELSKAIRNDLKKRGVDGVSVRKGDSGYTTHIYVTIKATGADLASIEEAKERYNKSAFTCDMMANRLYYNTRSLNYGDYKELSEEEQEKIYTEYVKKSIENFNKINVYHTERKRYFEMTTKFYNKVLAVYKIANQWNYDNSDSMTDYYDVGYYLTINIETNSAKARETMTEEERATLDDLKKRLHPCALNEAGERLQFFSGNNLIIDYHKTSPEIIILSL